MPRTDTPQNAIWAYVQGEGLAAFPGWFSEVFEQTGIDWRNGMVTREDLDSLVHPDLLDQVQWNVDPSTQWRDIEGYGMVQFPQNAASPEMAYILNRQGSVGPRDLEILPQEILAGIRSPFAEYEGIGFLPWLASVIAPGINIGSLPGGPLGGIDPIVNVAPGATAGGSAAGLGGGALDLAAQLAALGITGPYFGPNGEPLYHPDGTPIMSQPTPENPTPDPTQPSVGPDGTITFPENVATTPEQVNPWSHLPPFVPPTAIGGLGGLIGGTHNTPGTPPYTGNIETPEGGTPTFTTETTAPPDVQGGGAPPPWQPPIVVPPWTNPVPPPVSGGGAPMPTSPPITVPPWVEPPPVVVGGGAPHPTNPPLPNPPGFPEIPLPPIPIPGGGGGLPGGAPLPGGYPGNVGGGSPLDTLFKFQHQPQFVPGLGFFLRGGQ